MSTSNIRFAKVEDSKAIQQLVAAHAEYEGEPFLESGPHVRPDDRDFSENLFGESSEIQCLVVEEGDEVVGYATFVIQQSTWAARPYLFMDCLFLEEQARGRGLGRSMMDRIRTVARELGCEQVRWHTPEFNEGAIRFYRRLGAVSKMKTRFNWHINGAMVGSKAESDTKSVPDETLGDSYSPRRTRLAEVRDCNGWKLKVYTITVGEKTVSQSVIDSALAFINGNVVWPYEVAHRYGFVILHTGEERVWALVKVWVKDILRQYVFCAPLDDPTKFDLSPLPGFNACVWELEVTMHERDAWVKHVMSSPTDPDFDGYLSDEFVVEP